MMSYTLFRDYLLKERKTLSDLLLTVGWDETARYHFYSGKKKMLDEILIKLAEGDFQE